MIDQLKNIVNESYKLNVTRVDVSNNWFGRKYRFLKNLLFTGLSMQAIPSIFAQAANEETSCLNGTFAVAPENNATQLHSYIWRVIPTFSNALNSSGVSDCCEQMEATFNAVIEQLASWVNSSHSNEICKKNATEIFSLWSNAESLAVWLQANSFDLLSSLCDLSNGNFPVANDDIRSLREQWAQCEEENSTAFHFQWWHAALSFFGLVTCYLSITLCARQACADKQPSETVNASSKRQDAVPLVVYRRAESSDPSSGSEIEQPQDHVEIDLDAEGNTRVVD